MKYIFGYGSILNQTSLQKTLPGEREVIKAEVYGYQRKCNAPVNGYLYMNLVPNEEKSVLGVLVEVSDKELQAMGPREPGYDPVDVTKIIAISVEYPVISFIAPDRKYPGLSVPQSYLATCTRDMSESEQKLWIKETIMDNPIINDLSDPVYVNAAF